MAITLQESLRGLFYAPFYVAPANDAYAAEGVEVRFVSSPRSGDADRLRASLVSGGFVSPGTDYEIAVDNSLADAVIRRETDAARNSR
jgi:hypothetical protein